MRARIANFFALPEQRNRPSSETPRARCASGIEQLRTTLSQTARIWRANPSQATRKFKYAGGDSVGRRPELGRTRPSTGRYARQPLTLDAGGNSARRLHLPQLWNADELNRYCKAECREIAARLPDEMAARMNGIRPGSPI
ncbi:hypothetical protein [Derxia lacustris]|uniref:hypothetical protein n=1 Tax=Derxia lacustris TaxID=764842 RepID=UPI00111C5B40|nr:hypothetical protein [Derxia lacustris]